MLTSITKKVNGIFDHFLNILLAVMVVVVFAQVIFRFVLEAPLPWSEEVARYTMVWITFLGAALAIEKLAHPKVEVFVNLLPIRIRVPVHILAILLSCVFYLIIVYYGSQFVTSSIMQPSAVMRIPMGYVYTVIPVSGLLLILNSLSEIQLLIRAKREVDR